MKKGEKKLLNIINKWNSLCLKISQPECRMADPICTFLFSGLVLATTIGLIRDASHVLMEGVPRNIEYDQVRLDLKSIEGVHTVHDLNIWSLTLDRNAITAHLTVSKLNKYYFI